MPIIAAGTPAPDFTLSDQDGNEVSLADLEGQTSVLVFYPMDFSPTCTDQLNVYQEVLGELREKGAHLYGISVDSAFAHKAFQDHLGISFPLLSDFEPKGEVARAYGAVHPRARAQPASARDGRPGPRCEVVLPVAHSARDTRRQPHLRRARTAASSCLTV